MFIYCKFNGPCLFLIYFDYAITVVPFPSLYSPSCCTPLPPAFSPLSSCPRVIHRSSSTSTFPILFFTSSSILYLPFMLLTCCTFSPIPLPADNSPCDLYFCESVPVLVVYLVHFCFCFFLGSVVDSYEFVILLFIFLSSFSYIKSL